MRFWIVYVVIALAAYPFLRTGGFVDQWLGPYGFWIVLAVIAAVVFSLPYLRRGEKGPGDGLS